jgi:bvrC protein
LRWADENPEKNASQIGPSTSKALDLLRAGKSYVESGKYGTTNGSAMKVSPLGILHNYHDIQGLVDDVCKLCLPTHNTSIAIAGASVIATLVSYALRHEYDEEEIWSLAKLAIEEGMKHGNQLPSPSLSKRLDLIRQDIKILSEKEVLEKLETVYGVGFETIETIPAVLAMIILSKGNPMKSAQLSANIAGDSDTIGAISTAICGAFHPEFNSLDIKHIEEVNGINFKKYVDGLERVFK